MERGDLRSHAAAHRLRGVRPSRHGTRGREAVAAVPRGASVRHRRRPGRAPRLERGRGPQPALQDGAAGHVQQQPHRLGRPHLRHRRREQLGRQDLPDRPLRRRHVGRRHVGALVPALRPRQGRREDPLGAGGLQGRAHGEAPPQVQPLERHPRHRRKASGRALRQRGRARGLRFRRARRSGAATSASSTATTRNRAPPSGDTRARPFSTATSCSCRGTGGRTRSSPPTASPTDRRPGGWRATRARPGPPRTS